MPRGNGMGPMGMGPMTGRAAGICAGYGAPGYANSTPGGAAGMGFGRDRGAWNQGFWGYGRGRRNMYRTTGLPGWMRFGGAPMPYQNPGPDFEKQTLKNQAETLQAELDLIRKRLSEIESGSAA